MYKELIDNIFNDFKDFFPNTKDSKFIKYRILNKMSGGMKVSRTGTKSHIAISSDIESLNIDSDESKIYILFMIGHELTHLVNKHLEYDDKNKFDSQTLEMWADYFGAKISMSILQNGRRFKKMLNSNFQDVNIGLETIFKALLLLKDIYINTNCSNKYLNSNDRTSTVIAGITAFLTRKDMILDLKLSENKHADIGFAWGMAINRKLYELGMFNKLYTTIDKIDKIDIDITKISKNVYTIHNKLKQKNRQLIKGLDLYHAYILDTSYGEHKPNQMMIDKFNNKFDEIGWDIEL